MRRLATAGPGSSVIARWRPRSAVLARRRPSAAAETAGTSLRFRVRPGFNLDLGGDLHQPSEAD